MLHNPASLLKSVPMSFMYIYIYISCRIPFQESLNQSSAMPRAREQSHQLLLLPSFVDGLCSPPAPQVQAQRCSNMVKADDSDLGLSNFGFRLQSGMVAGMPYFALSLTHHHHMRRHHHTILNGIRHCVIITLSYMESDIQLAFTSLLLFFRAMPVAEAVKHGPQQPWIEPPPPLISHLPPTQPVAINRKRRHQTGIS